MPFATLHFLARVIAGNPVALRSFDRLAVDDARAGRSLPTSLLARRHHQQMVDRRQQATVPPSVEISAHRRNRREAFGQHPLGTAARRNIQDRVHHLAQAGRARAPAAARRGKRRFDQRPFLIAQIAWIARPMRICCRRAVSVQAMCFSYRLDNDGESQLTDIAQHLFVRALNHPLIITVGFAVAWLAVTGFWLLFRHHVAA